MLPRLDVDQSLDIHLECALDYVHAGLAAVAGIARTPSFVIWVPRYIPRKGSGILKSQGNRQVRRVDRSVYVVADR